MESNNRDWLAPLTGVAFIVVAILAFVIAGDPPEVKKDNVQDIVDHYVDNKDAVMIGAGIETAAAALLVFFFGYLRKVLRAAEGPNGMLSLVAFGGAVIAATGIAIDAMIAFALADAIKDLQPAAVQSMEALWDNDFFPIALGTTVILWAAGLSILRHGALPKWLGWVAIVLGVLSVTPIGFVSFLGLAIWILIVSVMLTLRERAPQEPQPGPALPTG
jgi:hypothetical protein